MLRWETSTNETTGHPIRGYNAASAADLLLGRPPVEGLIEARDEALVVERLAQETVCTGLHGLGLDLLLEIRRYKDHRNAAAVGDQSILQVDSAHARHMKIGNHAGRLLPMLRLQVFFG